MKQEHKKNIISKILMAFIIIFMLSGIILITYPFFTDIPTLLQRSSSISNWQAMKDKFASGSENTRTDIVPETTEAPDSEQTPDTGSPVTTTEVAQESRSLDSTPTTLSATTTTINVKIENPEVTVADIFPARLTIPKINVDYIALEGADVPTLKKGPGHITQTPLPGQPGRCAISGHRTTYGAPFNRIDELKDGDLIYLDALNGYKYCYRVKSFHVVAPTFVEILNGTQLKELLLTTCYPEYSAKERLVVIAELVTFFPLDLNLK